MFLLWCNCAACTSPIVNSVASLGRSWLFLNSLPLRDVKFCIGSNFNHWNSQVYPIYSISDIMGNSNNLFDLYICVTFQNWAKNCEELFCDTGCCCKVLIKMGSSKIFSIIFMETHPVLLFTLLLFLICFVSLPKMWCLWFHNFFSFKGRFNMFCHMNTVTLEQLQKQNPNCSNLPL